MRGVIVAVSPEGVIGLHGKIPWHHKGDMRRFKRVTLGSTVIMGRKTWESMGGRALPGRRNLVVTTSAQPGVECFPTVEDALATSSGDVWFIGGRGIYAEAMDKYADTLDVTYVPDHVTDKDAVRFPAIDEARWEPGPLQPHEDEPELQRRVWTRR